MAAAPSRLQDDRAGELGEGAHPGDRCARGDPDLADTDLASNVLVKQNGVGATLCHRLEVVTETAPGCSASRIVR